MRVLVVGGDSLIGAAFAQATTQRGDTVFATTRRKELADRSSLFLDLARDDIDQVALPPVDSAFFCAAVSGFAVCRTDPALARRVNVEGTARLVGRLTARGVYCVLLSSTAVFNFQKPHVAPDTPTCPLTMHGQIKAESEDIFRAQGALGAILRLTKVITPNAALFAKWVRTLAAGGSITAYTDLHLAPISLDDATLAMSTVARDRGAGIYQISGAGDISYFDLARHLAAMMGLPADRVRPALAVADGIPVEEVARFTTLESSRIEALTRRAAPEPYAVVEKVFGPTLANPTGFKRSSASR